MYASAGAEGQIFTSEIKPDRIWLNGKDVTIEANSVELFKGSNTLLLKYTNNDETATAEVKVNGHLAGILVCAPWKLDISQFVKQGDNDIEILVYNTLSNHYSTIPLRYSNFPKDAISGLIGPVDI